MESLPPDHHTVGQSCVELLINGEALLTYGILSVLQLSQLVKISVADPGCSSRIRFFSIPDPHQSIFIRVGIKKPTQKNPKKPT
jgi:hypothetical protein